MPYFLQKSLDTMLRIHQLNKTYRNGVKAIDEVSLDIGQGMFGLLAPNGAGKSSLMRTIVGLQRPDSGAIHFQGEDVLSNPDALKRQLGYLPQDFGVYPKISAYDLLTHLAILKGLNNAAERKEQVLALLEKTNLYTQRRREVAAFSGGMRQRFGIAQALLGDPQLIIVDEPTAGLDPEERQRFNNLLSEIGENKCIILSTHLVEDVRNLCTRMAVMQHGAVLAEGNPEDFVAELRGALWQKAIDKADRTHYEQQYQVLSSPLQAGRLSLRVQASSAPEAGFVAVEPNLEDAYFSLLLSKNRRHEPLVAL
jgi:ABC-2 type transport system ATP-binding protein